MVFMDETVYKANTIFRGRLATQLVPMTTEKYVVCII